MYSRQANLKGGVYSWNKMWSLKSLAMVKCESRNSLHAVKCKWQPGSVLTFCSYYFISGQGRHFVLTLECLIDVRPTQDILFLPPPSIHPRPLPSRSPVHYWERFLTQANFLKQCTYAEFFTITQNKRPVCIVFCFACSFKEANTLCFAW